MSAKTRLTNPPNERQRVAAILNCEEARGREELARALALQTNATLKAAKKLLATAHANALDDSVEAEVQKILAYVPKARIRMPRSS
jgi:hypothetical protein